MNEITFPTLYKATIYATSLRSAFFFPQLATKEVIRQYSMYVNNFTPAISVLERGLRKKPKFVTFLSDRYKQSNTSLSLQGLLLKPIQRFPQYIMFLQVGRACNQIMVLVSKNLRESIKLVIRSSCLCLSGGLLEISSDLL